MDTADAAILGPTDTRDAAGEEFRGSAAARLFCGARIGSIRITGLLGEGALGIVYRAVDEGLGEDLAVKVLKPEFAARTACVRKFLRGAIAAARVEHPNLVRIHRVGIAAEYGFHYVVMERLRGRDLQAVLEEDGPLPVPRVLPFLAQAAAGLHAAHEMAVVHRDVKPANLMVGPDGTLKVTDLGIARTVLPAAATSGLVGTPAFTAPEQYEGGATDRRADVFGFGVCTYYLLSGRLPWDAPDGSRAFASMLTRPPRPLTEVAPGISPRVWGAVERMITIRPEERTPDLAAAMDALRTGAENGIPPADR
jgi:serine/threonine-protein kinase